MQHISYKFFVATLLFAPLAFGSVETWSIGLVEALVFLTSIIYCWEIRHKSRVPLKVPGILPLSLLLLFMWLQLIPLPPSLVNLIAPGIYQAYAPILDIQENNQWIPLTVNQKSTLLEALRITSYAFFYILTVQLLSHKTLLQRTIKIIAGLAIIIAFVAILQKFTSPDHIFWFRPVPDGAQPMGPWVNRNHYAGFMELLFPIVLALLFYYRPAITRQPSFRSKVVSILSSPRSNIHFFLAFSVFLILTSIFLCLSRGGIFSTILALSFFLILLARTPIKIPKYYHIFIIGGVLLVVTWFDWAPILTRFNESTTATGSFSFLRIPLWRNCSSLIRDFLLTGSGFGTFVHTFPQYNTITTTRFFTHAHNDYIELLTDGGLVGFFLVIWFVVVIVINGFKNLSTRREPYSILLVLAGLTGIFSILIHSLADFNMHNGANGLYFFLLCGILISAGNTRLRHHNAPTLLSKSASNWKPSYLIALPLLILTCVVQGGILIAKYHHEQASQIYINPRLSDRILRNQLNTINKCINYDPWEGLYSYDKGNVLLHLQKNKLALHNIFKASKKDPLEGSYLQLIGLLLPHSDKTRATLLMIEGYKRSQDKKGSGFVLAEWYLRQGERQSALDILQRNIEQFPSITQTLPHFMKFHKFSKEEVSSIIPSTASAWIVFGNFSENIGNLKESEYYRKGALSFLKQEELIKPEYFMQLYSFYRDQERTNEAINTLTLGIKWVPNNARFHIILGDYYEHQGHLYKAKEKFKQALMLEPSNEIIIKRLEKLNGRTDDHTKDDN